jgi:hypothetical protein
MPYFFDSVCFWVLCVCLMYVIRVVLHEPVRVIYFSPGSVVASCLGNRAVD